ncbi:unnamed protein product [Chrysoparadoxa australica]
MVFVNRRETARVLCSTLQHIYSLDDGKGRRDMSFGFVVGQSIAGQYNAHDLGSVESARQASKTLQMLRDGKVQVLIATAACAEGIDVPTCSSVIAFDRMDTSRVLIHVRGRCRQQGGAFHVMVPDEVGQWRVERMLASSELIRRNDLIEEVASRVLPMGEKFASVKAKFRSGAVLDMDIALAILNSALMSLGQVFSPCFHQLAKPDGSMSFEYEVNLPACLGAPSLDELIDVSAGRSGSSSDYAKAKVYNLNQLLAAIPATRKEGKAMGAFEAVCRLHFCGLLDDNLCVAAAGARLEMKNMNGFDASLCDDHAKVKLPVPTCESMRLERPSYPAAAGTTMVSVNKVVGPQGSLVIGLGFFNATPEQEKMVQVALSLQSELQLELAFRVDVTQEQLGLLYNWHINLMKQLIKKSKPKKGEEESMEGPPDEARLYTVVIPLQTTATDSLSISWGELEAAASEGIPMGDVVRASTASHPDAPPRSALFEVVGPTTVAISSLQPPKQTLTFTEVGLPIPGASPAPAQASNTSDAAAATATGNKMYNRDSDAEDDSDHDDDDSGNGGDEKKDGADNREDGANNKEDGPDKKEDAPPDKKKQKNAEREPYVRFSHWLEEEDVKLHPSAMVHLGRRLPTSSRVFSKATAHLADVQEPPVAMGRLIALLPHKCTALPYTLQQVRQAQEVLPAMFRLERLLVSRPLSQLLACPVEKVEEAVRKPGNELLETVGDAWLKFYLSLVVCQTQPVLLEEGLMTHWRYNMLCNSRLLKEAKKTELIKVIHPSRGLQCSPFEMWRPPGMTCRRQNFAVGWKTVPDAVEALMGCCLLEHGESCPQQVMEILGFPLVPGHTQPSPLPHPSRPPPTKIPLAVWPVKGYEEMAEQLRRLPAGSMMPAGNEHEPNLLPDAGLIRHLAKLEAAMDYRFTNPWLALQSLTHASYTIVRQRWPCQPPHQFSSLEVRDYQRLEFLGDAILSYLSTVKLYFEGASDPGALTAQVREHVNNRLLAEIAVDCFKVHQLIFSSPMVKNLSEAYVAERRKAGRAAGGEASAAAPKVLADTVEALMAAVYLDSGYSMHEVCRVFWPLLSRFAAQHEAEGTTVADVEEGGREPGEAEEEEVLAVYFDRRLYSRSSLAAIKEIEVALKAGC